MKEWEYDISEEKLVVVGETKPDGLTPWVELTLEDFKAICLKVFGSTNLWKCECCGDRCYALRDSEPCECLIGCYTPDWEVSK